MATILPIALALLRTILTQDRLPVNMTNVRSTSAISKLSSAIKKLVLERNFLHVLNTYRAFPRRYILLNIRKFMLE
jgi:hypothetical protein